MWKSRQGNDNKDDAGDVAGQEGSSWHQRASAYVSELQAELDGLRARGDLKIGDAKLLEKADTQLDAARMALDKRGLRSSLSGSAVDRAWANIHRVELCILKVASERDFFGWRAEVLARAQQHLGAEDPIRRELESHVDSKGKRIDSRFKDLAFRALRAANDAQDFERARLRSFRNILLTSFLLALGLAVALTIWGYVEPAAVAQNLCFQKPPPHSRQLFCPIGDSPAGGGDVLIVEFFGLCGAVLAGAISLRNMQGTATPFMVPICLLLLRLPVGALAAVFGIVIINGEFVPGFSNLDSAAQVLAWSFFFGIAQEAVTHMVDEQGKKVIGDVRGPSRAFGDEHKSKKDDDGSVPPREPTVSVGPNKRFLPNVFRSRS